MSHFRSFLILLIFFLLSCNSNADSYKVVNVASNDVLNVRSEATSKSSLVGALEYNAANIVLTGKEFKKGKFLWVEIKHNKIVGWVNSKYIEKQTSPIVKHQLAKSQSQSQSQSQAQALEKLTCNGSEPDWFLLFDPSDKTLEFESISIKKQFFNSQEIKQSKNNTNKWFVNAKSNSSKEELRFSLIETNQCSDDMSDFTYKYAINIDRENNGVYSGCCNRIENKP